jgi:uncharacterized protein (TIGR03067 family)
MLTASLLLAAALAPADAPPPPPDAAVSDAGQLQGEWEVVRCVVDGDDLSSRTKSDRWRFAGSSCVYLAAGFGPEPPIGVQVCPAAHLPAIDLTGSDGRSWRGICRPAGDELALAYDSKGGPRPPSFDPAPGVSLFTLRRVKK